MQGIPVTVLVRDKKRITLITKDGYKLHEDRLSAYVTLGRTGWYLKYLSSTCFSNNAIPFWVLFGPDSTWEFWVVDNMLEIMLKSLYATTSPWLSASNVFFRGEESRKIQNQKYDFLSQFDLICNVKQQRRKTKKNNSEESKLKVPVLPSTVPER